jgi:hypothetical protein
VAKKAAPGVGPFAKTPLVTVLRVESSAFASLLGVSSHDVTRLLRRAEVADLLGVSCRTLDRLVRAGALPVVYIDRRPRYLAEDVRAFVRSRRSSPCT